ncbi:MAG: site-specific integrase [Luteibacter sp.]|uniref:tyrosine-type recombinase/integrase n=1 Tax=Luteibacter sp. TaxID=1886636 RepID=UPI0028097EDD|nr:site-specific integrase [Luteibacter sp.]MDQ7996118.1 site-specific integrase [Luteibacter sp.]
MATVYWRGERAYLNWRENGRQVRLSLGAIDAREAERIRSAKEAELTHGVRILARLPTVKAYLDWYMEWYDAEHPTTGGKARSEVKRFVARFGHRPIDTIRPTEVEAFKRDRLVTDRAAPETVGKELRRLMAAFRRGVEWGELDVNPLDKVKAPRGVRSVAVRFYTSEDMAALYAARPPRAPLWAFMAHTGIRRGEMCQLVKADVVAGVLRVESEPDEDGEGRTKSGRWREVPLNAQARAALELLPDPPVTVHRDTLSDWFSADAKVAGIGGTLHRLRHTFCAHLAMAGVPLRRIQLLAGHSDYKITERYAHLAPGGADGAVALLTF